MYRKGDKVWIELEDAFKKVIYIGPAKIIKKYDNNSTLPFRILIPIEKHEENEWEIREKEIKYKL